MGDILIESGRTVVFVLSDIADFIVSQISLIGRVGVTVKKGFDMPLPSLGQKQASSVTVASLRLDCAVAALCGFKKRGKRKNLRRVCYGKFNMYSKAHRRYSFRKYAYGKAKGKIRDNSL